MRSFSERIAVNMPIQGTAADMIKLAMIRIDRDIVDEGLGSRMILQVHDELVFEVVPGERDASRRSCGKPWSRRSRSTFPSASTSDSAQTGWRRTDEGSGYRRDGPDRFGQNDRRADSSRERGALVDCDALGARALEAPEVRREDRRRVRRRRARRREGPCRGRKLARVVFASDRDLARLNRIVRPRLKRIITDEVLKRRARADYIVLDAVLLFQYKFRFKVDYAVVTRASSRHASGGSCAGTAFRAPRRSLRIERQRKLEERLGDGRRVIATDGSLARVRAEAEESGTGFSRGRRTTGGRPMQEKLTHREIEERVLEMERQLSGLRGCL